MFSTIFWNSFWEFFSDFFKVFQFFFAFGHPSNSNENTKMPGLSPPTATVSLEAAKVHRNNTIVDEKDTLLIDSINIWCIVFSSPEAPRLLQTITVLGLDL